MTEPETTENPSHMVDLIFTRLKRLNCSLYTTMRVLSPFGADNPKPIFKMEGLRLIEKWSSGINKQNLRLRLESSGEDVRQVGTFIRGAGQGQALKGVTHVNVIFKLEASDDESSRRYG